MSDNFDIIQLVLLAMVFAFLWLRLKSVLGRRMGDEPPARPGATNHLRHPDESEDSGREETRGTQAREAEAEYAKLPVAVRRGLDMISRAEPGFSTAAFLDGARHAYTMILEAFWAGDIDQVKAFLGPDVAAQFGEAIDEQSKAGLSVENRLVELSDVEIDEAKLDGDNAEITVKFVSDIIAVTRNADGEVIEGDTSDTTRVTDIWTFARKVPSADPNWVLIATRAG